MQFVPLFLPRLTAPGPLSPVFLLFLLVAPLATALLIVIGVVRVLSAQGTHVVMACEILMLASCANLLLLILINMSVTGTLRRAGLHVGLMGVKPNEIERVLDPNLCKKCGYNLTGNVSGICPECGSELSFTPPMAPG